MATYYRGPDARITHEVLEVRGPWPQVFPIRELYDVRVVLNGGDRRPQLIVRLAGLAAVPLATAWWLTDRPPMWMLALGLAAYSAARTACIQGPAERHELWATYRSRRVLLYATRDSTAFGQLKRALQRALERVEEAG